LVKVARAASSYSLYFNGTLVKTVADNSYSPHYLVLGAIVAYKNTQMQYDYVRLSLSGGSAPVASAGSADEACSRVWPILK
jgi:hypothetical protein